MPRALLAHHRQDSARDVHRTEEARRQLPLHLLGRELFEVARVEARGIVDEHVDAILWPAVAELLPEYPDIKVEIDVDYGLTDIVADRYDAGVRFGDQVAKDMIAVRIGPDLRLAIVGSPSYFAARPEPRSPRDLVNHKCINFRQPSAGGLYAWEFEKRGRELRVRVDGQLIFNRMPPLLDAARAGFGLACVMDDMAEADVAEGRLTRVLADWCAPFSGYHLYYPGRRQLSPALALLVNALRFKEQPAVHPRAR